MSVVTYTSVEDVTKAWLLTTPIVARLTRPGGGVNMFFAMPVGAPLPCLTLARVGGAPTSSEVPTDVARISFECWGTSKASAGTLAYELVAELDTLARVGGFTLGATTIVAGDILMALWLPDPTSDTARYVVDAHISAITTT